MSNYRSEYVKSELKNGVVWLTLLRTDKKNALTQDMYRALTHELQQAERDSSVSAVVMTGSGDSFTAGNDLQDFLQVEELDNSAPVFEFLYTVSSLTVPVIAGVNGLAIGIGTTLLLHCDLVYASSDAKFALPFVDLGLVPEAASSLLLPAACGHLRASELLLLGSTIDADTARNFGLVNKVVKPEQLQQQLEDIAAMLASKPAKGLRATKALMKLPAEPVADRIDREVRIFVRALSSEAAREAIKSRLQRKK